MKSDLERERIIQQSRGHGKSELYRAWLDELEQNEQDESEQKEQDEFIYVDQPQTISKRDTIRQLRRALEASGHTKARAKELAKVHYKSFVKIMRG